jgi:hypothetical protein
MLYDVIIICGECFVNRRQLKLYKFYLLVLRADFKTLTALMTNFYFELNHRLCGYAHSLKSENLLAKNTKNHVRAEVLKSALNII